MPTSVQSWIKDHDDRWSFILLYVGGAIALSIYAGLFWVGMLMILHMTLEFIRHRIADIPNALSYALWETKLDIGLFLFALVIVLYSDSVIAALGIGQAARAAHAAKAVRGAQAVTRFSIIQRSLRVLLLIIDDLAKFFLAVWRGVSKKKVAESAQVPSYKSIDEVKEHDHYNPPWSNMNKGDLFGLGFSGLCLLLIFSAPMVTGTDIMDTIEILLGELRPV